MVQSVELDLKQLVLSNASFGPQEVQRMVGAIAGDFSHYRTLREAVGQLETEEDQSPASNVRLGGCLYLLGRYARAVDVLRRGDGGALAHFYRAKSLFALEDYQAALESYDAAKQAGYDAHQCALGRAEALRYAGNAAAALAALDELFGAVEQTAEYLYQRGATVAALGGNPNEVVALYERAVATDSRHPGALFGLALESDRHGDDERALELCERAVQGYPTHVGSLLNLGLMYEDRLRFESAQACYRRIVDSFPSDPRARLYYKDAAASGDMYFDEEAIKR